MQGPDPLDPAQAPRPAEPVLPTLELGTQGLRIGVLGGWFRPWRCPRRWPRCRPWRPHSAPAGWWSGPRWRGPAPPPSSSPTPKARHCTCPTCRPAPHDFEPLSRERFLAGALLPAAWVQQAQRVRHWFAHAVARSFEDVDVLIAPATPCAAPAIGTEWLDIAGQRLPARASMGLLTQPVSCIGLPSVI